MNNAMALRRIAAAALMAAAVGVAASAPAAHADVDAVASATATEYRFGVFYGDRRIGEHNYEVVHDGAATRVSSRADFQVKILFVTAYRYRHQANELWQDGCLTGLSSVTNDNGERYQVQAERTEPGLRLTRMEPSRKEISLDQPCPAGFAYWDRSRLDRDALINAQTGEVSAGQLIEEGNETIDGADTVRYRLQPEGLAPITLWYRASDDLWVRLETRRDDNTLQYRLESVSQRSESAIEEDARVQDPPGI
ncbi:MAG: DUF6134 family protein [Pseudomonadales bacterium]